MSADQAWEVGLDRSCTGTIDPAPLRLGLPVSVATLPHYAPSIPSPHPILPFALDTPPPVSATVEPVGRLCCPAWHCLKLHHHKVLYGTFMMPCDSGAALCQQTSGLGLGHCCSFRIQYLSKQPSCSFRLGNTVSQIPTESLPSKQ